ncbi:hypothetical protein ACWEN3_00340, partial [Streptomyces sp. NPDC004561]
MAVTSATLVAARRFEATAGNVAIVAPDGSSPFVETFARQGWRSVAVQLAPHRPGEAVVPGAYADTVEHRGSLRHTVKALRALDVTAVVAGSAAGVEPAERIAWHLGLPQGDPE